MRILLYSIVLFSFQLNAGKDIITQITDEVWTQVYELGADFVIKGFQYTYEKYQNKKKESAERAHNQKVEEAKTALIACINEQSKSPKSKLHFGLPVMCTNQARTFASYAGQEELDKHRKDNEKREELTSLSLKAQESFFQCKIDHTHSKLPNPCQKEKEYMDFIKNKLDEINN